MDGHPDADCREALAKLQLFLDGEVGPDQVGELRDHLADCYPCADRVEFERHFRLVVRTRCHESEHAPPRLVARIQALIEQIAPEG